ncbi:MAG: hypothetical protein KDG52_18835 [Rhodocyclaceae bacterium]|nr:hypothetical protein [Rhodocyclaceae bacterium]
MRTLILFLLLLAGIYFARRLLSRTAEGLRVRRAQQAGNAERMVACAHCGVHVPESEAVLVEGVGYCSAEHRRLHRDEPA